MNTARTLLFIAAGLVGACAGKSDKPPAENPDGPQACTKEAKICPDGTTVGRTGPNCEFAPCPEPAGETAGGETPTPAEPPAP
ncbi:hypothetical protein OV203_06950 [Nannocystis sp. ILAH1]|uniref:hypothetical protein n=1 Tax=unclassified Nannocystis TaxID=2627009 RepID=UPI00226F74E2|nr:MULTISPECIES: hypothetical protein [unclassified Nannocystis]MCY0986852.1 hypothetical protein [Nannocystis sp. ILAH1]MCY1071733.1 hypothetical protein [Nannocystis sp. RBIL2]